MRIVTFIQGPGQALGVLDGDHVIDLRPLGLPTELGLLLKQGERAMSAAMEYAKTAPSGSRLAFEDLELAPLISTSGKFLCLGLNYVDHVKESGRDLPDYPVIFTRCSTSLVAHNKPMIKPRVSEQFDFEGELAVIIGKTGRQIREQDALEHVAGYSLFNDGSVRDYQRRTHQWTVGKNFDFTGSFGPCLVTPDELPSGASGLRIETRLNGDIVQSATTSDMIFSVSQAIGILSEAMTLETGDVLFMGTPSGVGAARKPPLWMKAGDTIEVEIERIGVLRNVVADE